MECDIYDLPIMPSLFIQGSLKTFNQKTNFHETEYDFHVMSL